MSSPADTERKSGVALGVILMLVYVVLQAVALAIEEPLRLVVVGVSVIYLGSLFLLSYFYEDRSFLFRGLIFVCERLSHPARRTMAFFYFALAAILGMLAILAGLGVIPSSLT